MSLPKTHSRFISLVLGVLLLAIHLPTFGASLKPIELRCDQRVQPLGVDVVQPRLSWTLQPGRDSLRNQSQTAYHILVASSADLLRHNKADLWDSGKVKSDQMAHVRYGGKPLNSNQICWWKVRVWDPSGKVSDWSKTACWQMGLLNAEDWKAKWIGANSGIEDTSLNDCYWIWFPEADPDKAPPATRYFRKEFSLPKNAKIRKALAFMSADNEFTLYINGKRIGADKAWETFEQFDVTDALIAGANSIAVVGVNGGKEPNRAGLIGKVVVELEGQPPIIVRTDKSWKTSVEKQTDWQSAGFNGGNWTDARELGKCGVAPWMKLSAKHQPPMPLFRHQFVLNKPVRNAVVHVCGLGFYELHLNGEKVGENELDPGWTNYRKRCLYSTFDVTRNLHAGANAFGVLLGNGMYNVRGGRYVKFTGSFGDPKLIVQMHVEYADGTAEDIGTDGTWKTVAGPIVFSCIYGGEDYDARLEQAGWDKHGFDDRSWAAANEVSGPGGKLAAQSAPPIKVMKTFAPVKVTEPASGVFVYDLGQNFSGRPKITVKGPAGSTVKLIPGELLDDKGFASQRSSGGPTYFSYTLKGKGEEVWHPRFSYYGFRYVQVEGASRSAELATGQPVILDIQGQYTHSSANTVGHFECSSDLFNRIHRLILAATECNMQSVLTDCPHREKLGWLEVSHLLGPAILFNYDASLLYRKISQDMSESQLENGMVPDTAPEYVVFNGGFRDSPEWGSASVVNPWMVYERSGDRELLATHYDTMKRYVDYLGSQAREHVLDYGLGDWYDIGPGNPGVSKLTSLGLTATAIYYHDVTIVQKTAVLLGHSDDAARYASIAGKIRDAFNRRFLSDAGLYDRGSQTAQAMPLVVGLVPDEKRQLVLENLVKDVRGHNNHLTAGDVGFRYLMQSLNECGRSDVIFDIATRTDAPSYADQLNKGATTLTEAWDCAAHSSQNHCMLGHIEEWFYSGLAGINPDSTGPGFRKIIIKPQIVGDITWAKATYESISGPIESSWHRDGDELTLSVAIPANTTATVVIPATDLSAVRESGKPVARIAEPKSFKAADGIVTIEIGSGRYEFNSRIPAK